jgi:hypothetical protein
LASNWAKNQVFSYGFFMSKIPVFIFFLLNTYSGLVFLSKFGLKMRIITIKTRNFSNLINKLIPMKKLILLFSGLFLMANISSAQVDDRAVIPVAVTLNSILRLNVVSGGNIEFNFNTLNDYTTGIPTSPAHQTELTIASSVNWELAMYTEDATLIGTDDAGGLNTLALNNIGYRISYAGNGVIGDYLIPSLADTRALIAGEVPVIGSSAPATISIAGDINKNSFIVHWRCGTGGVGGADAASDMIGQNILQQSAKADRYATNVFLILKGL